MHLGALIRRLEDEDTAADALGALGDIVLFARVSAACRQFDETVGAYVAASVGRFASAADDAAWSSLIAHMERGDDPGRAALAYMLGWALAHDEAETSPGQTAACPGDACGHAAPA